MRVCIYQYSDMYTHTLQLYKFVCSSLSINRFIVLVLFGVLYVNMYILSLLLYNTQVFCGLHREPTMSSYYILLRYNIVQAYLHLHAYIHYYIICIHKYIHIYRLIYTLTYVYTTLHCTILIYTILIRTIPHIHSRMKPAFSTYSSLGLNLANPPT